MILIADSGSTKSNWALCSTDGIVFKYINTLGFNPNYISQKEILKTLKNSDLYIERKNIKKIFFYGAGCSTKDNVKLLKDSFSSFFKNANITVSHDLDAAIFASYNGKPCIVGILGTGSNSCYFDGTKTKENAPSLGFVLGDEGSGNYFGKKLLHAYFNKNLPLSIKNDFELTYNLKYEEFITKLYHKKQPNLYLATFFKFVYKHKKNDFINTMLINGIDNFFKTHILCYNNHKKVPINFVGSIAYLLQNYIKLSALKYDCKLEEVIKYPIKNLVRHHFKLS